MSLNNSDRRNFEHEQFSAKRVHIYTLLNSEKCVQYENFELNPKSSILPTSVVLLGHKSGIDGTSVLFAEKRGTINFYSHA